MPTRRATGWKSTSAISSAATSSRGSISTTASRSDPDLVVLVVGQQADTFPHVIAQPDAALAVVGDDLRAHAWIPELLEMSGYAARRLGPVEVRAEEIADVVRHPQQCVDRHQCPAMPATVLRAHRRRAAARAQNRPG